MDKNNSIEEREESVEKGCLGDPEGTRRITCGDASIPELNNSKDVQISKIMETTPKTLKQETTYTDVETRWLREGEKFVPTDEEMQVLPAACPIVVDKHKNFSVDADDTIASVHKELGVLFTIIGCIVKVHKDYVILYAPVPKVWKTLVKMPMIKNSPYIQDGHAIKLGNWMTVDAVPRHPQAYDQTRPPHYSHIAISQPLYFNINIPIPKWEQRFFKGVYQIHFTVDLKNPANICAAADNNFLLTSTSAIVAIVPGHRLLPLIGNVKKNQIRFWANRGLFMFGHSLHLFEETEIEEILPGGAIRRHISPIFQNEVNKQVDAPFSCGRGHEEHKNAADLSNATMHTSAFNFSSNTTIDTCLDATNNDNKEIESIFHVMMKLGDTTVQEAIAAAGLMEDYEIVKSFVDAAQEILSAQSENNNTT